MKKAIIYVFSGTGNTKLTAKEIAEELNLLDIDTTIFDVRIPIHDVPDPKLYDVALFGYPIHAFNTPKIFLDFIKRLPEVSGLPAYIFKTSGEPFHINSVSSWSLIRKLKRKGFIPMMDRHLLMPYNIMFKYQDALAKQMFNHTLGMAKLIAIKIKNGDKEKLRYYPWYIILHFIFRIQWIGAKINGPLIHVKKNICSGCGICVAQCPTQNIEMRQGIPHFSHHCTMCMNCSLVCPNDAVRPGILNLWRVNGRYPFKQLIENDDIPSIYINSDTKGYFKLFLTYYNKTYKEIREITGIDYKKI